MYDYTIIVPTRNNEKIANDFLINCLEQCKYKIILIDDNSDYYINYVTDERIKIIRNKDKKSLTKLWNQGVIESETNKVIICSHKSRPNRDDFKKNKNLNNEKYAMVIIGGFHFFSFDKFLLSKIGFFDENFKQGQFEDNDILNRLVLNNLSYYLDNFVESLRLESGWEKNRQINQKYYFSKWSEKNDTVEQLINVDYHYPINFDYNIDYKTHENTVHKIKSYKFFKKAKKK